MVDMPTNPPPVGGPTGPNEEQKVNIPVPGKGFKAKPMTFLGMYFNSEQASQLWQTVIQTINSQIDKDKAKALKALRKLRGDQEDE